MNGPWTHSATLQAPDAFEQDLITSIDAQRGTIAVGNAEDSTRGNFRGSVRVFRRASASSYPEVARLFASDAAMWEPDQQRSLGSDVDLDGNLIAASSRRAAYIFRLPATITSTKLYQDDFQDGNATGWQPSGGTWGVANAGATRVYRQSNLTVLNARSIWNDTQSANQSIEAQVTPTQFATSDRWFGLITRYTDENNYYYLSARNTNQILLRRRQNGVFTTIDSASLAVSPNTTYRLRLESVGTRIRAYVNGRLSLEAPDQALTAGRAGLITYGAQVNFDNVLVTPNHQTVLFSDHFEGQYWYEKWRVGSGTWIQTADESGLFSYTQDASAGQARTLAGVPVEDQVVTVKASAPVALQPGAWFGVIARYRDSGNFYYLRMGDQNSVSLRKQVDGAWTELDRASFAHEPGVNNTLRLEVIGSTLRGYVNGRLLLEAQDTSHASGTYGGDVQHPRLVR